MMSAKFLLKLPEGERDSHVLSPPWRHFNTFSTLGPRRLSPFFNHLYKPHRSPIDLIVCIYRCVRVVRRQ